MPAHFAQPAFRRCRRAIALACVLAALHATAQAQTYVMAPAPSGNVAGWMNNKPEGTLIQDWYTGSSVAAGGGPIVADPNDRRDTNFIASAGNQTLHGGLAFVTPPVLRTSQGISGLTATSLAGAQASGQYLEFPFTTAAGPATADGSPSPVSFYLNAVAYSLRNDIFSGPYAADNHFGYGVYLYDSSGNPVGSALETLADAASIVGETLHMGFQAPLGSASAPALLPNTSYSLRVYMYRRDGAANGMAGWDDTLLVMSRNTVAELSVTATPVTSTPSGAGQTNSYSFDVYNNGPDTGTAVVTDPLPAGAGAATWTCVISGTSTPCSTASGSGPIAGVQQVLASGQSVTYTVTWSGAAPATPDTHPISIAPSPGTPLDINAANNTAQLLVPAAAAAGAATAVPVGGLWWVLLSSLGVTGLLRRRLARS